jgi:hypothetical protein
MNIYFFLLRVSHRSSLTSNVRWFEYKFISRGDFHLTNQICKVELCLTLNSKIILESLQNLLGCLLSILLSVIGSSNIYIVVPSPIV